MNKAIDQLETALRKEANRFVHSRQADLRGGDDSHAVDQLCGGCLIDTERGPKGDLKDLLKLVEHALRRERAKARCGSTRYDFNRHLALLRIAADLRDGPSRNQCRFAQPSAKPRRTNIEPAKAANGRGRTEPTPAR